MLVISWSSTPEVRHVATFVKSAVVGVRVVVDTFRGTDENPCRVEAGPKDKMLAALLDPAGRYRLGVMIASTLSEKIDSLLEEEDFEFDVLPKPQVKVELPPALAFALGSIAPKNSVYSLRGAA